MIHKLNAIRIQYEYMLDATYYSHLEIGCTSTMTTKLGDVRMHS